MRQTKIPKIIHLIWFGGNRPDKFDFLVDEIKRINFDYEIIEWSENNINFELLRKDAIDMCDNMGAKSDILRFEVLYKFGGIYMDYDFLQIKKFDDLLDNEFFAGSCKGTEDEVWNSIMGSTPKNIICETYLNKLKLESRIGIKDINGVMNLTGPFYLKKIIEENNLEDKFKYYGGSYFYPFPAVDRGLVNGLSESQLEYAKTFIDDKTYCIHLHTTTWQVW
jgi:mannosyltransferase OCH1-like enzyme